MKLTTYHFNMEWKQRYIAAYKAYFEAKYPDAMATGYFAPKVPAVAKANGLTNFILNYLTWCGYRATRISSAGRWVRDRYIPGTTRKGTADISATIKGRSVMLEVKVGKDKPSAYQLQEQLLEQKAGGIYEFVRTPEQFFQILDDIIL